MKKTTLIERILNLNQLNQKLVLKDIELKKREELIKKNELKIFEKIKDEKIKNSELIELKGVLINPYTNKKKLFGIIPLPNNFKNYKTLIEVYDKSNNKEYIGINEKLSKVLTLFDNSSFITIDEENKLFYKGKRILSIKDNIPMNMKFDIKQNSFFVDSNTFHYLINSVFDYKLTIPTKNTLNIFEWLKQNWIVALIVGVLIYLSSTGKLNTMLGF